MRANGKRPSGTCVLQRLSVCGVLLLLGCQGPPKSAPVETLSARNDEHVRLFGDFELPRKIGSIENVGLQIPAVSPDGHEILYLRTDAEALAPMTLLGSPEPQDTPAERALTLWIRPLAGSVEGRPASTSRWAHSPVWSDSGRAFAYVVNLPPKSMIVHVDLASDGKEQMLGVRDAINCLPRFCGDDHTLLFCSGPKATEPFRICRQSIGDAEPVPLTPEGADCVLPLLAEGTRNVLCARTEADHLNWVIGGPDGITDLVAECGSAERPAFLQTWGGICSPLSPDRQSFLFYDNTQNRIGIWHHKERRLLRHRPRSIAACWLTNDAIALATAEDVFAVNTVTGMSLTLFNGSWIPCRYIASEQRLILLGRDTRQRLSIYEIVFRPRGPRANRESGTK